MKTCTCDKCGKEIQIAIQEEVIGHDKDGEDITEQFFVCWECGAHYTIFFSDPFMRRKIAAVARLKRMPMNYNPAMRDVLIKEMQKHFRKLKDRYGRE